MVGGRREEGWYVESSVIHSFDVPSIVALEPEDEIEVFHILLKKEKRSLGPTEKS